MTALSLGWCFASFVLGGAFAVGVLIVLLYLTPEHPPSPRELEADSRIRGDRRTLAAFRKLKVVQGTAAPTMERF